MNKLPEYFVIKKDESNPLWRKYLDWLSGLRWDFYKDAPLTGCRYYYGYSPEGVNVYRFNDENLIKYWNLQLITLEEWDEAVNGFVLPEKWCVKGYEGVGKWFTENADNGNYGDNQEHYYHFPKKAGWLVTSDNIEKGYIEITFEQFKKHVLKMEEREIIGYKCPTDLYDGNIKKGSLFYKTKGNCYSSFQNTHDVAFDYTLIPKEIVETWEPVYKKQFKTGEWVKWIGSNPVIGTIKSQVSNDYYSLNVTGLSQHYDYCSVTLLEKVTKEEILEHLTKEAQSKGFVIGAKVQCKSCPQVIGNIINITLDNYNNLRVFIDYQLTPDNYLTETSLENVTLYKEPSFNYDKLGNADYLTCLTEAQIDKNLALKKLQRIANYVNEGWVPDFNLHNQTKYYITRGHWSSLYRIDDDKVIDKGLVYFKSREIAQKVINDNPELMKEIFG